MTIKDAIVTLNANVVIACERAGFSSATVKIVEDALDTIEDALKEQETVVPLTIDDAVSEIMDKHYERLKEQEAVEPRRDANCVRMFRCGACGEYVGFIDSDPGDSNEQDNYCRNCGKQVKWE